MTVHALDRTPHVNTVRPMPDNAAKQIEAGRDRGMSEALIARKLFWKGFNELQIAHMMDSPTHVVKSYLFARVG